MDATTKRRTPGKTNPPRTPKALDLPCSAEQMAEIIAALRTLAAVTDVSAERAGVRELALQIDQRLGPINGRFTMVDDGQQLLRRSLDDSERPLATLMGATLDLLLSIQLGAAPADGGTKLRTLAGELETQAKAPGALLQDGKVNGGRGAKPTDLKNLDVASRDLHVSRSWLQTRIERDKLPTHRPGGKHGTGPHQVSMAEAAVLAGPRRAE